MKKLIQILCIVIFSGVLQNVIAQEINDTLTYRITSKDGNIYIGKIIAEDSINMHLLTPNIGSVTIRQSDIKSVDKIVSSMVKDGKFWYPNLQSTRYFFMPNGYGLKKGEAYYQNVWILFNQLSVGITNNVSIGVGMVPLFLFAGSPTPVWVIPKISIPVVKDKFNLGAGALIGGVIGAEQSGFGLLYGITTFGSSNTNVSIGFGYGYLDKEWTKKPILNISSFIRLSPRTYLVTENYYIPSDDPIIIISFGARTIINKVGLDYGLFLPLLDVDDGLIALPWLGLTVPVGNHKKKEIKEKK